VFFTGTEPSQAAHLIGLHEHRKLLLGCGIYDVKVAGNIVCVDPLINDGMVFGLVTFVTESTSVKVAMAQHLPADDQASPQYDYHCKIIEWAVPKFKVSKLQQVVAGARVWEHHDLSADHIAWNNKKAKTLQDAREQGMPAGTVIVDKSVYPFFAVPRERRQTPIHEDIRALLIQKGLVPDSYSLGQPRFNYKDQGRASQAQNEINTFLNTRDAEEKKSEKADSGKLIAAKTTATVTPETVVAAAAASAFASSSAVISNASSSTAVGSSAGN